MSEKKPRTSRVKRGKKRPDTAPNAKALERLEVVYVPIDAIGPNPYNPNRQSEHDFTLLCKSIAADGFTQPVIVNRTSNQIVDGEHRWRACRALGFDEIPVVLTDMTPEQMRISTLRHNRARGKENPDLVIELFRELAELGATDVAVDELMLDPVELDRITKLDGDELARLDLPAPDASELGPDGRGLTAQDQELGVDTTADERRARERRLEQIKADEEQRMGSSDAQVYRLQLIYTDEPAATVKRVLAQLAAPDDPDPVPAAIRRLCQWAEQNGSVSV